jgi:hypothetical protein
MKISDFSMESTHGFLGLFKYKKELHTRRERQNRPELGRSGSGLRFNSKCVWVAKMEVWCKYVRGLNAFGHRNDGELINVRRLDPCTYRYFDFSFDVIK